VLGIAIEGGLACLRFILRNAVEVDDAVAQMDVVAGDSDGALDQEEVGSLGIVGGENEVRSTRTWSPISRVFSIDAEGISKFWKTKVMTKRPTASTVQMEANDSKSVSVCSACFSDVSSGADSVVLMRVPVSTDASVSVSPIGAFPGQEIYFTMRRVRSQRAKSARASTALER
jgi:hypothetical protein